MSMKKDYTLLELNKSIRVCYDECKNEVRRCILSSIYNLHNNGLTNIEIAEKLTEKINSDEEFKKLMSLFGFKTITEGYVKHAVEKWLNHPKKEVIK